MTTTPDDSTPTTSRAPDEEVMPEPTGAGEGTRTGEAEHPDEGAHAGETAGRRLERVADVRSAWPGWPMLGSRILDLFPEGLRESAVLRPGEGFAVEELVEDGFLVIRAECPGVDPEKDVDVTVEEGVLVIDVRRQDTTTRAQDGHRRSEFRYGHFTRRLPLPRGATADVVSASYADGILEVRLPAPPPGQQVRRVPVSRA